MRIKNMSIEVNLEKRQLLKSSNDSYCYLYFVFVNQAWENYVHLKINGWWFILWLEITLFKHQILQTHDYLFQAEKVCCSPPPLPVFLGKKLLQNKWNNWIFVLFSFPAFWLYKNKQKQSFGMFCKRGVLKTFAKFTGKHLRWSLFFHKVADLSPATLLIERLWDRCFPANFANFLKTSTFIQHFWWLLPLRDVLDI